MCNNFERKFDWTALNAALDQAGLAATADSVGAIAPANDVRVNDRSPVLRACGNGAELVTMTWGFPPPRPKAAPVFNFRGEKRDFSESKRCLIPASAFFEFTGRKAPKSKWRFAMPGKPVFAVAGLWTENLEGGASSFTMLTLPPGPDVAPFHDRQIVTLTPADWGHWLYLDRDSNVIVVPPAGSLSVSLVREGREAPDAALLALAPRSPA